MIKTSDKNLLKSSGGVAVDIVVAGIDIAIGAPAMTLAWGLAKSIYGNSLSVRQDRALEFVEMLSKEMGTLNKESLLSDDFQDGFVFMIEKYIRERNPKKRKIAQKIFLGFATSQDKIEFDLERYTNVLSMLSFAGLNYLIFVNKVLKPLHVKMLEEDVIPRNIQHYATHGEAFLDLYQRFNILETRNIADNDNLEGLLDLEALGIVRTTHIGTIGGGSDETSFTPFGYKFLDFFEEDVLN